MLSMLYGNMFTADFTKNVKCFTDQLITAMYEDKQFGMKCLDDEQFSKYSKDAYFQ
jgi:hypothetical protein